jgi:inner membrane protein
MADLLSAPIDAIRRSQLLRVLLIAFLVLLLQIPIAMIDGLIGARRATRAEAVAEVTGAWGEAQTIMGPALAVPYVKRWVEERQGQSVARSAEHHAIFLPETLRIEGRLDAEVRYRGIFEVPVYRMTATLQGRFAAPSLKERGIAPEDCRWDRAQIWVRIADARAIQNQAALTWDGREIGFLPGTGDSGGGAGIHAPLDGAAARAGGAFSIPLTLDGSSAVTVAPFGRETTVRLGSNWPDPKFRGNWLPARREVTRAGFEADWSIPSLGRNYPQSWTTGAPVQEEALQTSTFGFDLLTPVDPYRMAERSTKYESLFLLLTFLSLWLFEVLARRRIHSLQYLLVGAAMCVFYLLELSLAEHLGFGVAYLLASGAVVGLITCYCAAVLQGTGRAAIVGLIVAGLYGFLYVLLRNQDYALLVGSVGLFLVLAVVMGLTRRIDWTRVAPFGHSLSARMG